MPQFISGAGGSLSSEVWVDFQYNAGDGAGASATATCRWCDKTLCAGGKNGTSHLRRHIDRSCPVRAEERRLRQPTVPAAAEPASTGDERPQEQPAEEQLYVVDGLDIPQLYDDLDARGLARIDQASDAPFWPNLPQAVNSSSRRFFQKKRERKRTGSNEKCVPDSFDRDFNFQEKRMSVDKFANSDPHASVKANSW